MKDYGTYRRHVWALPIELGMAAGVVVTFLQQDWKHFLTAIFTLAVSFLPLAHERLFRVRLPAVVQFAYVAFIFASMFAGEVLGMYGRFAPYDDIVHCSSGLLVGLGAVLILVDLKRRGVKLPPWLQSVMVLMTGASVAALWEIIEFTSDRLFGTFSQGNDLGDTMFDLIDGSGFALIVALLHVAYLRGHERVLGVFVRRYEQLNDPLTFASQEKVE